MKLLMFLAKQFTFRPFEKTLPDASDGGSEVQVVDAAVIFVHSEPQDDASAHPGQRPGKWAVEPGSLETKFVKNVKWLAGKRGCKNVVLHSFTHLTDSSASPQFAEAFLQSAAARLRNTGYQVVLTPFGWVCEWDLSVHGESLAKVFKSL